MVSFENRDILIHVFKKEKEAIVLLKQEKFLSDILDEISCELAKLDFSGVVVFDEMLLKGIEERFYCMAFNNKQFDIMRFVAMEDPGAHILSFSKHFYRQHIDLLNRSHMARSQKELVLKWVEE